MSAKGDDTAKTVFGGASVGARSTEVFGRYPSLVDRIHDRYEQPRYRPAWSGWVATFACLLLASDLPAASPQPFNPIRENAGPSTDRSLVDVEIAGSTSMWPQFHRLEPERVLRLRLERAYVSFIIAHKELGFEILILDLDTETGLPAELIIANAAFDKHIPGVPEIAFDDISPRKVMMTIQSDASEAQLVSRSSLIGKCRRADLGNGLFSSQERIGEECRDPQFPRFSYYAASYMDLWLEITCEEENRIKKLDCRLLFPFDGFGVRVDFYHDRLAKWQDVVQSTVEFLKSKEYH
jgi:hypothetical protein